MLHYFTTTALAILLFLHGFFPITSNNKEYDNKPPETINKISLKTQQIYSSDFKKAVIIVIDALRLDFVEPNLMPLLAQAANKNGCYSKITVESPTVTLPRVKAISTGSVPQFIDIVTNLHSTQILEDSLIHSAQDAKKKVVFYGDDIWLRLFPESFLRSEGTTSFYVKDFTEVDNNVTRNVVEELERKDWDIMILHYLGLDHIGHIFGPFAPLIPTKLTEMDEVIHRILKALAALPEKTLMVVTGDHGMRDSGGHGGSTYPEKHVPLVVIGTPCKNNSFAQTDIPVNLAALLGIKIPATSIGVLHSSLLQEFSLEKYLFTLRYNALFLNQKRKLCDDHIDLATNFHVRFLRSNDEDSGEKAKELYEWCSVVVSDALFKTSVKQNVYSLVISIVCMGNFLVIYVGKLLGLPTRRKNSNETIGFSILLLAVVLQFFVTDAASLFILFIIVTVFLWNLAQLITSLPKNFNQDPTTFLMVLFTILHPLTFSSSSFEEEEHQFWYFVLNLLFFLNILKQPKKPKLLAVLVVLSLGIRFLRTINQTGDKWAGFPDYSDWLLEADNHLYLQLFFIVGLLSVWASVWFLSSKHSVAQSFFNFIVLFSIFIFKDMYSGSALLGQVIWLLIVFKALVFYRKNLKISWVFIATLLLKPYNILLITYCILASRVFVKLFKGVEALTLAHVWLGNALYFAQGHSNSLASVDISAGYIGLSSYEPILVISQVLFHTYALPILCHFLLLDNKHLNHTKIWTILFCNRLYIILITCVVTIIHRHHLFIWSVFAPKLFIEATHSGVLFIEVVVYYLLYYIKVFYTKKSKTII